MKLLDKVYFYKRNVIELLIFFKMVVFEPLGFKVDFSDFRTNLTIYHLFIHTIHPSIIFLHTTYIDKLLNYEHLNPCTQN